MFQGLSKNFLSYLGNLTGVKGAICMNIIIFENVPINIEYISTNVIGKIGTKEKLKENTRLPLSSKNILHQNRNCNDGQNIINLCFNTILFHKVKCSLIIICRKYI